MKIYKVESTESKDDQQWCMVLDCISHCYWLNNKVYTTYPHVMNMKTNRINYEHNCWIALTYHLEPNKW